MFDLTANDASFNNHIHAAYRYTGDVFSRLRALMDTTASIQTRSDLSDTQKLKMIYLRLHEATLRIEKTRDIVAGAQAFAVLREKLAKVRS